MLGESHVHVEPDGRRVLRREIRDSHHYSTSKLFGHENRPSALEVPIYGHGDEKLDDTLILVGRKWGLTIWHPIRRFEPGQVVGQVEEMAVEDGYFVHVSGTVYLPNTMPWMSQIDDELPELPAPPKELTA